MPDPYIAEIYRLAAGILGLSLFSPTQRPPQKAM